MLLGLGYVHFWVIINVTCGLVNCNPVHTCIWNCLCMCMFPYVRINDDDDDIGLLLLVFNILLPAKQVAKLDLSGRSVVLYTSRRNGSRPSREL